MNLEEVLNYRRSVRAYDKEKPMDPERVKHCLELATLAPNSSNMQLWEFYHITEPVSTRKRLRLLRKSLFSLYGGTCTRNMLGSFSISNERIFAGTVQKDVRINVSKTGNYTTGN